MEIFDTHAHLLDEHFDEDREELIASLSDSGVKLVMEACTDLDYLEKLLPFVEAHPAIYGAAGLHPEELGPYALSDLDQVAAALAHPKIRAVGGRPTGTRWTCCGPTGAGSWASCTASPAAGRPQKSAWTWASAWASAGR